MLKAILAIIAASPKILELVKKFLKALGDMQEERGERRIDEGIQHSRETGDQREFEKAIGSDNAGKPTKQKLDSVQERPRKDRS